MTMLDDYSEQTRVGYLGPEGTYSHSALKKFFIRPTSHVAYPALDDIFQAVCEGQLDFGVVPVENSSEGSIAQTLNCLNVNDVKICGEVQLRIQHAFMIGNQTNAEEIHRIVSHQQSLGQCREWLKTNYPDVECLAVSSNAEAARMASVEKGVAAIAGIPAAEIYKLKVLAESIEDTFDNTTRFVVISKNLQPGVSGKDKTSLIISANDEPGTLFKALEPFHRFGISLTRLESRPSRKSAWSYAFYIDLLGHIEDEKVKKAVGELQLLSLDVKVLGSYPLAKSE